MNRSKKREAKGAKEIKGRPHVASGSKWFKKSDFSNNKIQVEDKFTDKDKFSVRVMTLKKIEFEAEMVHKVPVLRIGFERHKTEYALILSEYLKDWIPGYTVLPEVPGIFMVTTNKKSITIYNEDLHTAYLKSSLSYIGILEFNNGTHSSKYLIYEWYTFIKNQESFSF